MDKAALEERAKELDKRGKHAKGSEKEPVFAVRLDLVKNIINELESDHDLEGIFGEPVSTKLALVFDKKDGRVSIVDAQTTELEEIDRIRFLKSLDKILKKNLLSVETKIR
jgi:hypothetical protein